MRDDSSAGGAEGRTHRDLARSKRRPRVDENGDIDCHEAEDHGAEELRQPYQPRRVLLHIEEVSDEWHDYETKTLAITWVRRRRTLARGADSSPRACQQGVRSPGVGA